MLRQILTIGALLALTTTASAQVESFEIQDLPDRPMASVADVERLLTEQGLTGAIRNYWRARLLDASADVTGNLEAGEGVIVKFPASLAKKGAPEVHQHEFIFTYTPKTEIVQAGLQFRDSTGRWRTPVSDVWGSGGTLRLHAGLLVESEEPVDWYFYAYDTEAGTGKASKLAALKYRVSIKRIGVDAGEDPPTARAWAVKGTGTDFVDIPDTVLRFRIRGRYTGRSENFVVWCGTASDRGGLLVNEILGTSRSTTYSGVHENTRSYGGRGEPCETLHVEHSTGLDWEMEAISSR